MILDVIPQILPLIGLIALGYMSGRFLDIQAPSISRLVLFVLMPIVILGAAAQVSLDIEYILLPILFYFLSICVSLISLAIGKLVLGDERAYLLGSAGVNGNALYFGVPIIWALFGAEIAAIYVFLNLGPQINNITLGYFLTAKAERSVKESMRAVLKFPVIYGAFAGLCINLLNVDIPQTLVTYWGHSSSAMMVLGMMMVGIAIAQYRTLSIDWPLFTNLLVSKFIIWPLFVFIFLYIDHNHFGFFDDTIHKSLVIFCAMPLFANLIAYAEEHKLHPEKVAFAVLVSSIMTVVSIPLFLYLYDVLIV